MDASELEWPDPCSPGCGLLQECWEAAGVSTATPEMRPEPEAAGD
ncbi:MULTISPECIES: hypothetical protein [Pseudoxanthomonas]|nr:MULTISPECIES: hypothetical protein [Pseudoxanthomonas]MCR6685731.1 hypothetical protein [Pseudoxanthomonas sp.]